jgi:hypothetical protein
MTSHDPVTQILEAAEAFDRAAEARGSHRSAPDSLASLHEALQTLSAAWYRMAADAATSASPGDLTREEEVRVIGTLQDVAAAFSRCARACRDGRSTLEPTIAGRDGRSWFTARRPSTERAA